MANAFKGYESAGITTEAIVFTGPADTATTVVGMSVANVSGNDTKIDVKRNDGYIIKQASLPTGQTLVVIGGDQKVVVMASGTIKVSADNAVDVIVSTLEMDL